MEHCDCPCEDFLPSSLGRRRPGGFTLIELLLVIAIIGILSTLIITTVINASQDARMVVARQQQISVQDALNSWIAANTSGTNTLQNARAAYANAGTSLAKLALLSNYLHAESYNHFTNHSTSTQIKSDAMSKVGVYLQFSAWSSTNYPIVGWYTN